MGASCPGQFILPLLHQGIKINYLKLSEYEDALIITIIKVKLNFVTLFVSSVAGVGGGAKKKAEFHLNCG